MDIPPAFIQYLKIAFVSLHVQRFIFAAVGAGFFVYDSVSGTYFTLVFFFWGGGV